MPEQPIFESPQEEPELPTQEKTIEQRLLEKRSALEGLAERLGFKETPEMVLLRRSIGMPDGIGVDNLNAWRDQAESMVESAAKGEEFVRAQVSFLVLKATVYLDANMQDEFFEDLDDIALFVKGSGIDFGDELDLLNEI